MYKCMVTADKLVLMHKLYTFKLYNFKLFRHKSQNEVYAIKLQVFKGREYKLNVLKLKAYMHIHDIRRGLFRVYFMYTEKGL